MPLIGLDGCGREFGNFVLQGEFMQEQEIADSGVFLRFAKQSQE